MVQGFREDLGIVGGRVYRFVDPDYELVHTFGTASAAAIGTRVPRSYAAIEALLDNGLVVTDLTAPEVDPELEARLGTHARFAAIAIADGEFLVSFDLAPATSSVEDLRASLNIIRLAINQKLRQERFEEILEDARRIQSSILPKRVPQYAHFEMAGDSRPTEVVGGDFYDYIPLTPELVDVVVARATWASPWPTPRATACRPPSRCGTCTWACGWA